MTTQAREIRPAISMQHATEAECREHRVTRLWIRWADRHGFAWRIARRHYYNLPDDSVMESMDDDPTISRYYWELHVAADESALRPSPHNASVWAWRMEREGLSIDAALDGAISDTRLLAEQRSAERAAKVARLDALLSDLPRVLPRHVMTGSRMIDDLRDCGGQAQELAQLCVHDLLISQDDLRSAIIAAQN